MPQSQSLAPGIWWSFNCLKLFSRNAHSFWTRDQEPTLRSLAAVFQATTELGHGQVEVPQRFPTIFELPFSWFSICLVAVKLGFFPQSSDEVASDNLCFPFQCFSARIFPASYLLCHFCWCSFVYHFSGAK